MRYKRLLALLCTAVFATLLLCDAITPHIVHLRDAVSRETLRVPSPDRPYTRIGSKDEAMLAGITRDPKDPMRVRFYFDGDPAKADTDSLRRQMEYAMTALTVPQGDIWVNLAPGEEDRVLADGLEATRMGRDLLAQDYLLKVTAASFTDPSTAVGKAYWSRVAPGKESRDAKVWIAPAKGDVSVYDGGVFVGHAALTVRSQPFAESAVDRDDAYMRAIVRAVNFDRAFVSLRQMYRAFLLAKAFRLQSDATVFSSYADANALKGIDRADPAIKDQVTQLYRTSFERGAYARFREGRRYVCGGVSFEAAASAVFSISNVGSLEEAQRRVPLTKGLFYRDARVIPVGVSSALSQTARRVLRIVAVAAVLAIGIERTLTVFRDRPDVPDAVAHSYTYAETAGLFNDVYLWEQEYGRAETSPVFVKYKAAYLVGLYERRSAEFKAYTQTVIDALFAKGQDVSSGRQMRTALVKRVFGGEDAWRAGLLEFCAAIGMQETNFDYSAVSPVGARGVMQTMPQTESDMRALLADARITIPSGDTYEQNRAYRQIAYGTEQLTLFVATAYVRVLSTRLHAEGCAAEHTVYLDAIDRAENPLGRLKKLGEGRGFADVMAFFDAYPLSDERLADVRRLAAAMYIGGPYGEAVRQARIPSVPLTKAYASRVADVYYAFGDQDSEEREKALRAVLRSEADTAYVYRLATQKKLRAAVAQLRAKDHDADARLLDTVGVTLGKRWVLFAKKRLSRIPVSPKADDTERTLADKIDKAGSSALGGVTFGDDRMREDVLRARRSVPSWGYAIKPEDV